MKNIVEGSMAVAEAVKLCEPGVIAVYPITPQTHIAEDLAQIVANGELDSEVINVESEHSAMAACIGAVATGVRAYTTTSSQGLAFMHELLFVASGMRLPVVMTVVNRSLSAPLNIWNDQQDSMSERDCGWIQLYVENAQEAFDTQIQAFKIAEQTSVPVMLCMDGFVISHTFENVSYLDKKTVKKFLPDFKPEISLNPSKPVSMGTLATPEYFMQFRKEQNEAVYAAKDVIKSVHREYAAISKRSYGNGLIEKVALDGKKFALITIGSVTGTAREYLPKDFGIIKVKAMRPFPTDEVIGVCKELSSVGVIEKDISVGLEGALYTEIKAALYGSGCSTKVSGHIAGLGGRDITPKDMQSVFEKIRQGKTGTEWVC
ncbi:MAG: pyruvate ferredoxin oxidoreductase [Candidatus Aenigmarchaeota archaeon]|nr:pyruvate ferredoxin oxidoreductase [Candidatus Aenigmarchaeota archaeon]